MTTITVDATRNVWRVTVDMPAGAVASISGHLEAVLTDPATGLRIATVTAGSATIPTNTVTRSADAVEDETVTTSAGDIAFSTIMEALPLFVTRWADEDAAKPPPNLPPQPQTLSQGSKS
jgi:hypothetical protein